MGTQARALHDRQERLSDAQAEGTRSRAKGVEIADDRPRCLVAAPGVGLARRLAGRGLEGKTPAAGEEVEVALGLALAAYQRPARGGVAAGKVLVSVGRCLGRSGQARDDLCNRGEEGGVRVHGVLVLKELS